MRLATAINSPTRGASHTTRKLTLPNHDKMKHSELVKKVALAMATSEGWLLKELDQNNKHCQRWLQLATVAVETLQSKENPWDTLRSELQQQHQECIDIENLEGGMFTSDGEYLGEQHF